MGGSGQPVTAAARSGLRGLYALAALPRPAPPCPARGRGEAPRTRVVGGASRVRVGQRVTQAPDPAERTIASSSSALRTASSSVAPYDTPSAIERRKRWHSTTLRSS